MKEKNSISYRLTKKPFLPAVYGVIQENCSHEYDLWSTSLNPALADRIKRSVSHADHCLIKDYSGNIEKYMHMNELGTDAGDTAVYHFFALKCSKYTDAIVFIRTLRPLRIWVNFSLFTITKPVEQLYYMRLCKGDNIIVIETPAAKPHDKFSLRIGAYECEASDDNLGNFLADTHLTLNNTRYLHCPDTRLAPGVPVVFSFFPNDTIHVDNSQEVSYYLEEYYSKRIVYEGTTHIGAKCVIDTSQMSYDLAEKLNCLRLHVQFKDRQFNTYDCYEDIFLYPIDVSASAIVSLTEKMLAAPAQYGMDEYDTLAIQYYLDRLGKFYPESKNYVSVLRKLADGLELISQGGHFHDSICSTDSHLIFFKSRLDGRVAAYSIALPRSYDPQIEYPLLIILSTADLTENSKNFENGDVIVADVSQRGFTMGSYLGEASIHETLQEIYKRFSVDKSRIWASGHSSGAYAAWATAQVFPHLLAGILPVSGGMDLKLINNLSNTSVINISSNTEWGYKEFFRRIHPSLSRMNKSLEVCAPQHTHNSLVYFLVNGQLHSKLYESSVEKFPDKIDYTTRFNRHLRAFWVELHGIQYGKMYANVQAHIDHNCVYLKLKNAVGVTICLPPQVDKKSFSVNINGKYNFVYTNFTSEKLHYSCRGRAWIELDTQPAVTKMRKGTGLMEVFCDSMEIIPAVVCDEVTECANAFSEPKANGGKSRLHITYPVLSPEKLSCRDKHHNRIIIDCWHETQDPSLILLRNAAPVQMDADGYRYRGEYYSGTYCVMQLFPDPICPEYYILYICTNDASMLQKNILTRQPVLPTYSQGYNPFWNSDALIFDGRKYYRIFEFGMGIEPIS